MNSVSRATCVFAVACALATGAAFAQMDDYPNRPVRMINPYAPGGAVDIIARTFSQKLTDALGQPLVVDNRPGAGTNIGTEMVVRANPDGYTVLLTSAVIATNVSLYKLPFDPMRDLSPVAQPLQSPFVVAVHPSVPAKTMQELLSVLRDRSGEMSFGSAGAGTTTHLMFELLKSMGRFGMLHVPYKGGAPAINAVVSAEVQMSILPVTVVIPLAKAGRVRALAVTSAKRLEQIPELPTVAESGVPGYDPIGWYAIFAPAGTPRGVVLRLNAEINRVLRQTEVRERLLENGMFPAVGPPEALRDHLKSEIARWSKVIKSAGIQPE
jgi:tripartite-type tricarboxylate transporter receptor subunit TctC